MPTKLRRRLRLARRGLWYAAAVSLVLVALAIGIVSQLLPLAERNPDRIAEWLSARAGRPIAFDRVRTAWTRRGPLLRLDGLRVGEGDSAIAIGTAEILVSQYAGLLPGRSFTELRVRNLALTLERGDDGRWQVRGLPGQSQGGDPFATLEGLGELQVIDAKLGIVAPSLKIDTKIPDIDLRLRVDGPRLRVGARAAMTDSAAPIDVVFDFDRKTGHGRAYAAAKRADLSAWSSLLHALGVTATAGRGRVEAWATLRTHQIVAMSVDADLKQVHLRGASFEAASVAVSTNPTLSNPASGNATSNNPTAAASNTEAGPETTFAEVRTVAHWRAERDRWRMHAPQLRVHVAEQREPMVLDGLLIGGGRRYGLLAERIDAAPLFAVAALSDRLDPNLRRWLIKARPGAVLQNVIASGERGGALALRADVVDLGIAAVGKSAGIAGVSGRLNGDADGVAFVFDPQAKTRFDWPHGFGAAHEIRLGGEITGWREGAGWQVATSGLRIDGTNYGADVRGGLWFQGDGTRPYIDIAADLDDAQSPTAKRFWTKRVFAPSLVDWFEMALLGGHVRNGRAVISGDLDDWPFAARDGKPAQGVFDARATLQDMRVKFNKDWPATTMDADIAFVGNGFRVAGKAMLAEVPIREFSAQIEDFSRSELEIDAKADADAAKLLALMKQSPLQRDHGATMATLAVSGPASVDFSMQVPLHTHDAPPTIEGQVALRSAKLGQSEWKLAFANVSGSIRYDRNGFSANGLNAVYDQQQSRLSLRAGAGHVRDRRQGFEAELEATMSSDDLLNRSADLAWLKPYVKGRSRWTAGIAIPLGSVKSASNATTKPITSISRLQLRSDLAGTQLSLPAPIDKPAGASLPTTIDLELPIGKGEVAVAFGQRLALRAKQTQGRTGIRAQFGTDRVTEAPPTSGLILTGRSANLDAIDWIALLRGSDKGSEPLVLRRVDVVVDRLQLLGGVFPDTRLQVVPANGAHAVQLDGNALAGNLLVPEAGGATIAGRLQRVHWRSAGAGANAHSNANSASAMTTATASAPDEGVDPTKVPPLNLKIDDLRVMNAVLGETQFRSRPTATGMEITQLQTRAPKRRIDLSGEWNGRGAAARTRLIAAVVSEDFGALLGDLGAGGRIAGGKGDVRFDGAWPGSPMAFQIAALEGAMQINVKDGRLVEVEPGGTGRVIGLLSIAQLPRRLMLDFRDFFNKGFVFNKLGGTVRFGGGLARSDDLSIDGSSAQINIRGAANMRTQTFDQTIEVLPKAGNLLTAVGAIAGGPVGAAVGAVANAVLQKPIGQMAAKNYRVTGPWKDPKVEVVERPAAAKPARPTKPASG
jgi:uncharacterized protein (TIGR02099 family)